MNESEMTIIPAQSTAVASPATPALLVQMAVQQGADLDKLERLMAMQERWEANEARRAFNVAFAAFKAEGARIVKNVDVKDGPLKGKRYADLFAVVDALTPPLSKHGLSASWRLTKDDKDWMEVTCVLAHVNGHSETVAMGGPPDSGGAKNAIQARASCQSYLRRYTFLAITGMAAADEDDDGNGSPEAANRARVPDRTLVMKCTNNIREHYANDRELGILQEWDAACDDSDEFASAVWAGLPSPERKAIRDLQNRRAAELAPKVTA